MKKILLNAVFIIAVCFSRTAFSQNAGTDNLNKGIAELTAKHYQPAIDDFNLAIAILKEDKPNLCKAYYEKAKAEYEDGDLAECVYACNHCLAIDSNFKEIYWQIAKAFRDNKQYDLAIKNYGSAILHYSVCNTDVKRDLAMIYYERGNMEWRHEKYAQTIYDDSVSILLNPSYGGAYWDRGYAYNNIKNFKRSVADYTIALPFFKEDKKSTATLYNNIGYSQIGLKNYQAAIDDFNLALALNADYDDAYWGRGNAYRLNKQYRLCLKDYDKALTYYTNDNVRAAKLYNLEAYAEEDMKDYDKAIDDDSISRTLNPKYAYAYWELARCYDMTKNYPSAYYNANKAINLLKTDSGDLSKAYCLRGRIQVHSRHYEIGISDYNYAITLDAKSGLPYMNRAHAYLDSGIYQPAAADYNRAITLYKDDTTYFSSIYENLGYCQNHLKQYQEAIKSETKSIAYDSTNSYSYFERGRTYLLVNNKPSAVKDFKQSIKLDTVKSTYAFSKLFLGDTAAAVKMMNHKMTITTRTPIEQSDFEYDYACFMSLMNKPADALSHLKKAIDSGYPKAVALNDQDLDAIRNKPEFAEIIK